MRPSSKTRVFDPFRNRIVEAGPEEAQILGQLQRAMDFFVQAAEDRARLSEWERKQKSKQSLMGQLEMLDSSVAGGASWCRNAARHPDAAGAIETMMSYDIPRLLTLLKAYPDLQQYLQAMSKLRDMVVQVFANRQAVAS